MSKNTINNKKPSAFIKWFETFLDEKNLPLQLWEIEGEEGNVHLIDSGVVITNIKMCHPNDQAKIKDTIVKIDYINGDVNHYFHHMAKGLVANY